MNVINRRDLFLPRSIYLLNSAWDETSYREGKLCGWTRNYCWIRLSTEIIGVGRMAIKPERGRILILCSFQSYWMPIWPAFIQNDPSVLHQWPDHFYSSHQSRVQRLLGIHGNCNGIRGRGELLKVLNLHRMILIWNEKLRNIIYSRTEINFTLLRLSSKVDYVFFLFKKNNPKPFYLYSKAWRGRDNMFLSRKTLFRT